MRPVRRLAAIGWAIVVLILGGAVAVDTLRGSENLPLGALFIGGFSIGLGVGVVVLLAAALAGITTLARVPSARRALSYLLVGSTLLPAVAIAYYLARFTGWI